MPIKQGLIISDNETCIAKGWYKTLLAWVILAILVACGVTVKRALISPAVVGGLVCIPFLILFVMAVVIVASRSTGLFILAWSWSNIGDHWNICRVSQRECPLVFQKLKHVSHQTFNFAPWTSRTTAAHPFFATEKPFWHSFWKV